MEDILVFAHDAGGAGIVAAYISSRRGSARFRVYAGGPAADIFRRNKIPVHTEPSRKMLSNVVKRNRDVSYALLEGGRNTWVGLAALREAKHRGIKTCVYLDSWNNYKERFGYPHRGWQQNLPSEFWVGDRFAYAQTRRLFPHIKTRLVWNGYFRNIAHRYRTRKKSRGTEVLYLSDTVPEGEKTLDVLISHMRTHRKKYPIRIRLHPADPPHRYRAIEKKYSDVHIIRSKQGDIVDDLISARVVVGLETTALVSALIVGKKTICLAHDKREAFIPYKRLIRVKHAGDAAKLI